MKSFFRAVTLALACGFVSAHAQPVIGPAPNGEPTVVAQKIILENFDPPDCPLVVSAVRLGDGSIKALCTNGETYRVFTVSGQRVAMRCSVANKFGAGC